MTRHRSIVSSRLFWPAVFLLAGFAMVSSVRAQQTVTLQPEQRRVVVGAGFTTATNYHATIITTIAGGSSPVNFVISGAPAGVTTTVITNGITGSATVILRFNIASVAAGVYPLTIEAQTNGVTAASTNIDLVAGSLWTGASLTAANWSTSGNWTPSGAPGAATDVKFEDAGVATNVVDASVVIASLTYTRSASGNSNHTTRIANGQTLSVLGSNGLSINVESTNGNNKQTIVNLTGAGGATLFVSNSAAPFAINALNSGNGGTTVTMSNLHALVVDVNRAGVGDVTFAQNGGAAQQWVAVRFARTNIIRASYVGDFNDVNNSDSITLFHNSDRYNNGSGNTVELGAYNSIQADSFAVAKTAAGSGNNILRFGPAFTSIVPTAIFRNVGGGRMSRMTVGVPNGTANVGANSRATLDFRGGSLDMQVNEMILGANRSVYVYTQTSGVPNIIAQGTLLFNAGTLDVNTARLGYQRYTNDVYAQGVIGVGGSGVLVVNNELSLGYTSGGSNNPSVIWQGYGQLYVTNGGTARINSITVGKESLNNSINIEAGGTLVISNQIAVNDQRLRTLTMSGNGKIVLPTVSTSLTNIYVTNLVASAGVIEIQNVPAPGVYPIIAYDSASPTLSLILPPGFYGIVKDNTGNKTIDAVITTTPPKTVVWTGLVGGSPNGTWNTTLQNWVLAGTSIATNFDDGDFVIFDDSAPGATSVTISGTVFPGQSPATPGVTVSNNTYTYTITGGTFAGTGRTLKLGSQGLFLSATHNTALIISNGWVTASGSTFLGNGVTFAGSGFTNNGTISGPVAALAGSLHNAGTITTTPGFFSTASGAFVNNAASGTINAGGGQWTITAGSTLFNSGLINNLLARLNVDGTLAGPGIVADSDFGGPIDGRVNVNSGGVISPGASIGTMEIQGRFDLNAGARAIIEVDYAHASVNDRLLIDTMGAINGTFVMTNIGAIPFSTTRTNVVISGNFSVPLTNANVAHIPVMSPAVPGVGLQWDVSLMRVTNTLRVVRVVSVPGTPPAVTNLFQGRTNILMSWASTNLGYRVQQQTNNLLLGISTNATDWEGIPGTEQTNRFNVPVQTNNPAGFFRLSNQ